MKLPNIEHKNYIAASPEQVYRTISRGEGWDAFFTQGSKVEAYPGGVIRFHWKDFGPDLADVENGGTILEAMTNEKLSFEWWPGQEATTVTFTLTPRGAGTVLHVSQTGFEQTDQNLREHASFAVGWAEAMTLLKFYLEHGVTYGKVPPIQE